MYNILYNMFGWLSDLRSKNPNPPKWLVATCIILLFVSLFSTVGFILGKQSRDERRQIELLRQQSTRSIGGGIGNFRFDLVAPTKASLDTRLANELTVARINTTAFDNEVVAMLGGTQGSPLIMTNATRANAIDLRDKLISSLVESQNAYNANSANVPPTPEGKTAISSIIVDIVRKTMLIESLNRTLA